MTDGVANEESVRRAARNNAALCDSVCRAHGSPGKFHQEIWLNHQNVPRFYPNAITLEGQSARQLQYIDEFIRDRPTPGWALKDSFAVLQLESRGFRLLFDAEWVYRTAEVAVGAPTSRAESHWNRIRDGESLEEWESAWRTASGDTDTRRVFLPPLLEDENIAMVAEYRESRIVAGAIGNRSDGVVGWSNWFAIDPSHARAAAIGSIEMLSEIFPDLPIVGYENQDALRVALSVGFQKIGPLRVWLFDAPESRSKSV